MPRTRSTRAKPRTAAPATPPVDPTPVVPPVEPEIQPTKLGDDPDDNAGEPDPEAEAELAARVKAASPTATRLVFTGSVADPDGMPSAYATVVVADKPKKGDYSGASDGRTYTFQRGVPHVVEDAHVEWLLHHPAHHFRRA